MRVVKNIRCKDDRITSLYEMWDFLGFQFMVILNLYGIPFHAVVVFRSEHDILFKSASTYCVLMWKWFRRFYFSGTGGCLPERQACLAGCPVLYGPNIYCGLLPRDVCEMVGTWLCQIFHQCLVLAWFCHSYGRPIFIICKNEKIFFSVKLSRLGYETHYLRFIQMFWWQICF